MKHKTTQNRPQTPLEARVATDVRAGIPTNALVFELLLGQDGEQWKKCIHGDSITAFLGELRPIVRRALERYGLARDPYIDDGVQRLAMKLQAGDCFGNYRALDSTPRLYLLGCARMCAMTLARSIRREVDRNDWGDDDAAPALARRGPKPTPDPLVVAMALEEGGCAREQVVLAWEQEKQPDEPAPDPHACTPDRLCQAELPDRRDHGPRHPRPRRGPVRRDRPGERRVDRRHRRDRSHDR